MGVGGGCIGPQHRPGSMLLQNSLKQFLRHSDSYFEAADLTLK